MRNNESHWSGLIYHYGNGTRNCANCITHTQTQDCVQIAFVRRYAHAQMDRGGAQNMIFDLKVPTNCVGGYIPKLPQKR